MWNPSVSQVLTVVVFAVIWLGVYAFFHPLDAPKSSVTVIQVQP